MMKQNILCSLALGLLLVSTRILAGPIMVDGGFVSVAAIGHDADPAGLTNTFSRINPGFWTPAFGLATSEGRTATSGNFGFVSSTTGLQFDVFEQISTISADGPAYDMAVSDRSTAQLQLLFTVDQLTAYNLSGLYSGYGDTDEQNLIGILSANIYNLDNSTYVYQEVAVSPSTSAFDYALGGAATTIGSTSGVIGPGQYRLTWSAQTLDSYLRGGALVAGSTSSLSFQLGSYVAVPEPSASLLLAMAILMSIAGRRRSVL